MSGIDVIKKLTTRYLALDLTDEQAESLWDGCRKDLNKRGLRSTVKEVKAAENADLDTLPRSDVMDSIALELTGMYWPSNGDCAATHDQFVAAIKKSVQERNYKTQD